MEGYCSQVADPNPGAPVHRVTGKSIKSMAISYSGPKTLSSLFEIFQRMYNDATKAAKQREIDYKAKWDEVPVWYVNPDESPKSRPDCGSRVVTLVERKLYHPKCDIT